MQLKPSFEFGDQAVAENDLGQIQSGLDLGVLGSPHTLTQSSERECSTVLNLGAIFREFCELIHEEEADLNLKEWADLLGICPIRVGQALGLNSLLDLDTDAVDLEIALLELMNDDRAKVSEALVNIFGNESSLFASLFKACDGRQIEEPDLDDYFVLNDVTPNKMRGFDWITDGMPMLH